MQLNSTLDAALKSSTTLMHLNSLRKIFPFFQLLHIFSTKFFSVTRGTDQSQNENNTKRK
jgi:hypothetical protein